MKDAWSSGRGGRVIHLRRRSGPVMRLDPSLYMYAGSNF